MFHGLREFSHAKCKSNIDNRNSINIASKTSANTGLYKKRNTKCSGRVQNIKINFNNI